MMRLEPDGAPPQVAGYEERSSLRQIIYMASEIYGYEDLKFVGYAGIKNFGIRPPENLSIYCGKTRSCIMRSTWNIAWTVPLDRGKDFDHWLGEDAAQLTLEAEEGLLSFYAYNKPQILIRFPRESFPADLKMKTGQKVKFAGSEELCDVVESDQNGFRLVFVRKASSWFMETKQRIPQIDIEFCSTEVSVGRSGTGNTTLSTIHRAWDLVHHSRWDVRKHRGNVLIETDGMAGVVGRGDQPRDSGCHRTIEMKNVTWMCVSAKPMTYEDGRKRLYFGDKRERTVYTLVKNEEGKYSLTCKDIGLPRLGSLVD